MLSTLLNEYDDDDDDVHLMCITEVFMFVRGTFVSVFAWKRRGHLKKRNIQL